MTGASLTEIARTSLDQGRLDEAIGACEQQLRLTPADVGTLRLLGEATARHGDMTRTRAIWQKVLHLVPEDAEALFHLGNVARAGGNADDAARYFERAHLQAPSHVGVLNNLGLALEASGRLGEAEGHFRTAHSLTPESFDPLANLAQNLFQQKRFDDARPFFDSLVLRFEVENASIWANRGVCALHAGDLETAEVSYRAALARDRTSPSLYCDLGYLYVEQKRFSDAAAAFEAALALTPRNLAAESDLLFCRQNLADWKDFGMLRSRQISASREPDGDRSECMSPFNFMTICDDAALQGEVAKRFARRKVATVVPRAPAAGREGPLRLGFVSFDLYDHPVGRLIVDLVERLDRREVHVSLYAVGGAHDDPIRMRLKAAADGYREFPTTDIDRLADRIGRDAIDVLFDLNGYTGRALIDLFARRPAPMQVNFLGYTGTLGSSVYDFVVTDRYCIPEDAAHHYVERPLYISPCYLPSDSTRKWDGAMPSRPEYGLPDDAAVLCAFANTYKILPAVFETWMALLTRQRDAVLWLRDGGDEVNGRLRDEARGKGVDPERLVFARRDAASRYLSRFTLADLFLDTVPFGAHTTVNDALFAGLPVVAVSGSSFAGRASASQVRAAGLESMIARDLGDYLAIADHWLSDRRSLGSLTTGFRASVRAAPLFDMASYCRSFQVAIVDAWRAVRCGELARAASARSLEDEVPWIDTMPR